jgi:LPS sulfotransferase NodH
MSDPSRTRYIIIGMQRSGTTATNRAVFGHPNICGIPDEFKVAPFFTQGIAAFTVGGINRWERLRNYYKLFDSLTLYQAEKPDPEGKRLIGYCGTPDHPKQEIRANGLKVAIPNVEDAKLLVDSLQEYLRDLVVIYVRRFDWVAQFASLLRAQKTGAWHSWTSETKNVSEQKVRFEIPVVEFEQFIDGAKQIGAELGRLRESHKIHDFSYEKDLVGNSPACWSDVFEFLGVPPIEPVWMRSSKVAPPLEEFVANVTELHRVLESRR